MKVKAIYPLFFMLAALLFAACNKDDTEPETYSHSVRVSSFCLTADTAVLANLNTVFFTIDLEKGLIYNADSLPMGTDVSALAVTMTFENASSAVITQADGTSFDYAETTTTKIDFTQPVQMVVTSQSGSYRKTYDITVNVHTIEADLLSWGSVSYGPLPGDGTLQQNKTVKFNGLIYCFMQRDDAYRLAVAVSPTQQWTIQDVNFGFTPDIYSLRVANDMLYILDTDGRLYSSYDGVEWSATGSSYVALLGGWEDCLLTLSREGDTYYYDRYPRTDSFQPTPIDARFPVSGMSDMLTYTSSWMTAQQGMIMGGRLADGSLTGAMWGYDGTRWALLSNDMPAREGAVLFEYVTFIVDDNWVTTERTAWFMIGGRDDNSLLRDVWLTTNYGVTWERADVLMQLPAYVESRAYASAVVCDESHPIDYALWTPMDEPTLPGGYSPMAMHSASSQNTIPYIYMIGGQDAGGDHYNQIWRGVINRLSFEPIP